MSALAEILANGSFWVAVLRIATPLILGTLGVLWCERAGVLNLGIEGIMVAGAFTGWLVVYLGAPLWIGVVVAAATGAGLGLLHALLTVGLALSQHVTGTRHHPARHRRQLLRLPGRLPESQHTADDRAVRAHGLAAAARPLAADGADAARAAAGALVLVAAAAHARRPGGAHGRREPAGGRGPGHPGRRHPHAAIVAGSALMGVAGSFLTLSAFNAFFFNMINGRGWICVALVVFASWRPGKALLGALLFAFFDALQLRLQQAGGATLPYQVYLMLPYALSILALVLVARKAAYPQALMKPYRKGER